MLSSSATGKTVAGSFRRLSFKQIFLFQCWCREKLECGLMKTYIDNLIFKIGIGNSADQYVGTRQHVPVLFSMACSTSQSTSHVSLHWDIGDWRNYGRCSFSVPFNFEEWLYGCLLHSFTLWVFHSPITWYEIHLVLVTYCNEYCMRYSSSLLSLILVSIAPYCENITVISFWVNLNNMPDNQNIRKYSDCKQLRGISSEGNRSIRHVRRGKSIKMVQACCSDKGHFRIKPDSRKGSAWKFGVVTRNSTEAPHLS